MNGWMKEGRKEIKKKKQLQKKAREKMSQTTVTNNKKNVSCELYKAVCRFKLKITGLIFNFRSGKVYSV